MKNIIRISLIAIVNAIMNFAVFIVSYNKLATPFLVEEQRMDNADFIMTYILIGFAVVSIFVAFLLYFLVVRQKIAKQ